MFCTNCGQKNPDNYKFCSHCGHPLKWNGKTDSSSIREVSETIVKGGNELEKEQPEKSSNPIHQSDNQKEPLVKEKNQTEEALSPLNQYDEEGNIIMPVYDEPKKGKTGIIVGIITAAGLTGAGIWGYSAYVESVKQEADLAVWNAWEEYLKVTNAGQIFSTLGENIENIDHDSFSERKFNEYIKNNIEPSPDINWGDIGPLVKNIKIEVPPLREITPIMTDNLRSLYTKMDDSDYRDQGGWDPIAEMKETNNITITDIVVSTDGKTGKVKYHTSLDASRESPKAIYMLKNDSDLWEISDFKQDGVSFFATVQNFFDEKERNRVIMYEGNVYTSSGTFPITLEINYGSTPLAALYHNVQYNVSLEMTGYESDGFIRLTYDTPKETVAFILESKSNEVLTGVFRVTKEDGEIIAYDVVLNSIDNQNK